MKFCTWNFSRKLFGDFYTFFMKFCTWSFSRKLFGGFHTFSWNYVLGISAENCLESFIHFSWNFVHGTSAENCLGTFIHFSWNFVLGASAENCLGTFIHFSWNFVLGSFRRKLFGDFGWLCSTTSHFTPVIDILKGLPPPPKNGAWRNTLHNSESSNTFKNISKYSYGKCLSKYTTQRFRTLRNLWCLHCAPSVFLMVKEGTHCCFLCRQPHWHCNSNSTNSYSESQANRRVFIAQQHKKRLYVQGLNAQWSKCLCISFQHKLLKCLQLRHSSVSLGS